MRDNQLIQIFLPIVNTGLADRGLLGVDTIAKNQPTQQGIPTAPTVYFYKIADHRYGWTTKTYVWDELPAEMVHEETQIYETTFQLSSLVLQDPNTPDQYTASDLVNEVAAILQSDSTIDTLYNSGVEILRVTDIRNPYFTDDRDTFEASPSFDFTLLHEQARTSLGVPVDAIDLNLYPI